MRVEIDYRKPEETRTEPVGYIRLYPETPKEYGDMDMLIELFSEVCEFDKVTMWNNCHFYVKLHSSSLT